MADLSTSSTVLKVRVLFAWLTFSRSYQKRSIACFWFFLYWKGKYFECAYIGTGNWFLSVLLFFGKNLKFIPLICSVNFSKWHSMRWTMPEWLEIQQKQRSVRLRTECRLLKSIFIFIIYSIFNNIKKNACPKLLVFFLMGRMEYLKLLPCNILSNTHSLTVFYAMTYYANFTP